MAAHMDEDLRNHKLQLQQVEAALTTDPANEELLKLKADLEEIIDLTQDLIKTSNDSGASGKQQSSEGSATSNIRNDYDIEMQARLLRRKKWKPGVRCLAKWEQNQHFYDAIVDEILGNTVRVKFFKYNQYQMCHIDELKDAPTQPKKADEEEGYHKYVKPHTRDYLKKKKQKKQQRFKQIEEERESEKNKWLNFNTKSVKKAGPKGKSIFASPDNVNGRVGIGTCGISGKPMTEFSHGEMWRKGT